MYKTNQDKGFSLVELIIVIAIMALLIGLLTPLLLRYIEKTKVSSDIQLADTIRTAVALAIVDVEVQNDVASHPYLEKMATSGGMNINKDSAFLTSDTVLRESLETSFGFPSDEIMLRLRSAHASDCNCNITTKNGIVKVTFTGTDVNGTKDISSSTPDNDIIVE